MLVGANHDGQLLIQVEPLLAVEAVHDLLLLEFLDQQLLLSIPHYKVKYTPIIKLTATDFLLPIPAAIDLRDRTAAGIFANNIGKYINNF